MISQSPEELQIVAMRTAITMLPEQQKEMAQLFERDVTNFFDDITSEIVEKHSKYKNEFLVAVVIGAMESLLSIKETVAKEQE